MTNYYTGGLPQGTSIVSELDPEHTYRLPPSKTMCFPFRMRRYYQQLVMDLADTTPFENCFIPVIRVWPSKVPVGPSMTGAPNTAINTVNLGPNGFLYNFYLIDEVEEAKRKEASLCQWIRPNVTYWMNVQNLQNKESFFWLRYTFYGPDIVHTE